jgi:hypothetical protein
MPSYQRQVSVPGHSAEQIYDLLLSKSEALIQKVNEKFGSVIGTLDWSRDASTKTFQLKAKLFSVEIQCLDSRVQCQGQMSFLAVPLKSKIDEGIDRWIQKTFNLPS